MTKSEAAEILATYIMVRARQRGIHVIDATLIAECISEARHEKVEGSRLNVAGWVRPADQTIKAVGRRQQG